MGAYTKHTWATGEVITAEHLNNLEEGVAGINDGTITSAEAARVAAEAQRVSAETARENSYLFYKDSEGRPCVELSNWATH